ncbi:4'-phosphopantetheinyl transferase family protein [Pseudoalteromonas mariniglutinosa]|uniref:4'-phosphopantetheinyl transferase family protein n=1 Tax=Pseudoalteromonas mariniglutinosa TaxID=206042 RepID=UPI00384FB42B
MSASLISNTLTINNQLAKTTQQIVLMQAEQIDITSLNVALLLSPFECTVLAKRKMLTAKKEYIATRLLLKWLVKHQYPALSALPLTQISSEFDNNDSKLKLHIANHPAIHCCLSHSHGLVAAALNPARSQFGFDLEKIALKRPFEKLAKHFYHTDEINLIMENNTLSKQAECFYRIWTLKEALAKASAQPIAKLLSPNVFDELRQQQLTAHSNVFNGFDVSVVTNKSTLWQCSLLTYSQLRRLLTF